jgi:hypothetical protein
MKSNIRTRALPAANSSNRFSVAVKPSEKPLGFRIKAIHMFLLIGLIAPLRSFAAEAYCVAVGGGFGNGGTTFVARNFAPPAANKCTPWSGYTKTASTVILTTTGTACLSSDSKALTVSVTSADPQYFPINQLTADYIQLSQASATEPFTGQDYGAFAGDAEAVTCTSDLLTLPASHD